MGSQRAALISCFIPLTPSWSPAQALVESLRAGLGPWLGKLPGSRLVGLVCAYAQRGAPPPEQWLEAAVVLTQGQLDT